MKTRRKMIRSNKKAKDWLKQHGFREIHMFPHTRFSKDLNFKDLKFDGIAISDSKLCLFQVKSNGKPTKEYQTRCILFSQAYGVLCLWFNCLDGGEVEVYGL